MNLQDVLKIEAICNYKKAGPLEVQAMQDIVKRFIDPKIEICGHCSAQIKFHHQQIQRFADRNREKMERIKNSREIEKPQGVCFACGAELDDKRKKYCGKTCRDIHKNQKK